MLVRLLLLCAVGATIAYLFRARLPRILPQRTHAMSVDDAAGLLGIHAMANADEIKAAHRSAIKEAHPDAGGSASDAARINLARDTLLAYHRRHES